MKTGLNILNTVLTLAAVGILMYYPALTFHFPWWVGIADGYLGAGLAVVLIEHIWKGSGD